MADKSMFPAPCEIEIKGMSSADIDEIWNWMAFEPDNVLFELTLTVGCKGKPGGNNFSALIATRNQTYRQLGNHDKKGVLWFEVYSFEALSERLDEIIASCQSSDWQGAVDQLRRIFLWEYEGYK